MRYRLRPHALDGLAGDLHAPISNSRKAPLSFDFEVGPETYTVPLSKEETYLSIAVLRGGELEMRVTA